MSRIDSAPDVPLCAYNSSGGIFAIATEDGLLKTFDTGTGRLSLSLSGRPSAGGVSAAGHLHDPKTALAWAPLPGQQAVGSPEAMLLAGSASGAVQAFNALTGEEVWQLPNAHDGPVTSLAFLHGHVYSCGADKKVNAILPASGAVSEAYSTEATSLARRIASATGGENIVLAGSELYLNSADLSRRIRWFTGHPVEAAVLVTGREGSYAVSGSPAERCLAVWDLKPKKKKAQLPAAATLAMEHPATHAAMSSRGPANEAEAPFHVTAVSDMGGAYVWECKAEGSGQVTAALRTRIQLTSREQAAQTESLLAVWVETLAEGASLLLARGSTAKPCFERFSIPSSGTKEIQLQQLEDGLLLQQKKKEKSTEKERRVRTAIVSPEPALPNGHLPQGTETGLQRASMKRAADGDLDILSTPGSNAIGDANERMDAAEEVDEDDGDVTLGERVKALQIRQLQGAEASTADAGSPELAAGQGKADSLATLLVQGLRSDDKGLIERCLAVSNESVVNKTIANISARDAGDLLEVAVRRLRARANRGPVLAVWIRAVLMRHTAALMAHPARQQVLSALYQAIEARLALQQPLTALSGRLDLLMAQMPSSPQTPAEAALRNGPVVHVTALEDDVVVEDPFAADAQSSDEEDMADDEEEEGGEEEDEQMEQTSDDDF